jgi:hypothetical protein
MHLLDESEKALERLRVAEAARGRVDVAHALGELYEELHARAGRIAVLAQRRSLLKNKGISISVPADLGRVKDRVIGVASQFKGAPEVSTLKVGSRWTGLLGALDGIAEALDRAVLDGWKSYFRTALFAGLPPDVKSGRLAPTLDNKKRLAEYTRLYERFITYRDRVPETAERLEELQQISRQLEAITFVEDMPAEVVEFLRATATQNGASLKALTPDVLEWLKKQDLAIEYVVRARLV